MDIDRTRAELDGSDVLRALSGDDRADLVAKVIELLQSKFSHLPEDQAIRVARQALTWLVWAKRRRDQAEKRRLAKYASESASLTDADDPAMNAEAEQAREELRTALHNAIAAALTPEEQLVVLRRFIQDASVTQVAVETGMTEQRVYYLTRRALQVLRREMAGLEGLYL